MKLRQKVIFLAIVPLILALCAIALAVWQQAIALSAEQRTSIERAYLDSKQAELQHYVTLASHSIAHLVQSGRKDPATLEEAKRILSNLSYGDDGYFFVYSLDGRNLMHPRLPELVGRDLWNMKDANGSPTIQRLVARAKAGGGLERYQWVKPSTGVAALKLGYVVPLPEWGWMMGTGIYLDDVDAALDQVQRQQSGHIRNTMLWIAAIAILSAIVVGCSGLALNISELRVADAKLKALAQRVVESQEQERARLSRDLHDGISQWLVSIKLQIEAGVIRLAGDGVQRAAAALLFEQTAEQLNQVLGEVRRISHNLRPAILDDLGLAAALEHLAREASGRGAARVLFRSEGGAVEGLESLSDQANTMLFRIAQEALTNIERHAGASHVDIVLGGAAGSVSLSVADDGCGFDLEDIALHPARGIGLRNMLERMESIGGNLHISSSVAGTTVLARVDTGAGEGTP